jgi:hypothetical protein
MTYHPTKQTINTPTRREEKCVPIPQHSSVIHSLTHLVR